MFEIEAWQVWIVLGLLLAIGEVLGTNFVMLGLGLACAGGSIAAASGAHLTGQITAFALASAVIVPLLVYLLRRRGAARTYRDAGNFAGRSGRTERYNGRLGVRLNGDFFFARYEDGSEPEPDRQVTVVEMQGLTAIVRDS
jgi:membrane protein implicated in regulation of membrane protease activity